MTKYITILGIVLLCSLSSCYYDVEEELYPKAKVNACDSVKGVFAAEVEPLINLQCRSCHNNGFSSGGINLEGYENVKLVILNGKLLEAIKHESGVSPMPQGRTKLSDCEIKMVELWKNDGAPNN
jgi:hypothetical protein